MIYNEIFTIIIHSLSFELQPIDALRYLQTSFYQIVILL